MQSWGEDFDLVSGELAAGVQRPSDEVGDTHIKTPQKAANRTPPTRPIPDSPQTDGPHDSSPSSHFELQVTPPNEPSTTGLRSQHPSRSVRPEHALSHVAGMEHPLLDTLDKLRYDGPYKIQVGFNEAMLKKGVRIEEIYLCLEADFEVLPDTTVCPAFERVFAPFPGIVWTPRKVYRVPGHDLASSGSDRSSIHKNAQGKASGRPKTEPRSRQGYDRRDGEWVEESGRRKRRV